MIMRMTRLVDKDIVLKRCQDDQLSQVCLLARTFRIIEVDQND
jgi:hypothetical protein